MADGIRANGGAMTGQDLISQDARTERNDSMVRQQISGAADSRSKLADFGQVLGGAPVHLFSDSVNNMAMADAVSAAEADYQSVAETTRRLVEEIGPSTDTAKGSVEEIPAAPASAVLETPESYKMPEQQSVELPWKRYGLDNYQDYLKQFAAAPNEASKGGTPTVKPAYDANYIQAKHPAQNSDSAASTPSAAINLPPVAPSNSASMDELLRAVDDYSLFTRALGETNLDAVVGNPSSRHTVFAPTDAAFADLAEKLGYRGDKSDKLGVYDSLKESFTLIGGGDYRAVLKAVASYHIAPDVKKSDALASAAPMPTLLDATPLNVGADAVRSAISSPDVAAQNGVIHGVDEVFSPLDLVALLAIERLKLGY